MDCLWHYLNAPYTALVAPCQECQGVLLRVVCFSSPRSKDGFKDWTFSTVMFWGEPPAGRWTLVVSDKGELYTQISVRTYVGEWERWAR